MNGIVTGFVIPSKTIRHPRRTNEYDEIVCRQISSYRSTKQRMSKNRNNLQQQQQQQQKQQQKRNDQQQERDAENEDINFETIALKKQQPLASLRLFCQQIFRILQSCTIQSPWYKSCHSWIRKFWIRHFQRFMTIYVLACEDGKYYVGSTSNWKQRWREHQSHRGGSVWTRRYRPIAVHSLYRKIPHQYALAWEAQITATTMWKFGIQHVRGAMFSQPRPFTFEDLSSLTGFLGHYNNLDYQEVSHRLRMQLMSTSTERLNPTTASVRSTNNIMPFSNYSTTIATNIPKITNNNKSNNDILKSRKQRSKFRRKQNYTSGSKDVCYACGQVGHWAKDCPQVWGALTNNSGTSQEYPI
jgi:predicted GIY-YIG superfamily endonuclease